MEWVSCFPGQKERTHALLCVCSNLAVLLVFDAVCGHNVTILMYTKYDGDNNSACVIFVRQMYGMDVVLVLNKQAVRLYCSNLTVLLASVRCSIRS